jgi:hypothetical protein
MKSITQLKYTEGVSAGACTHAHTSKFRKSVDTHAKDCKAFQSAEKPLLLSGYQDTEPGYAAYMYDRTMCRI